MYIHAYTEKCGAIVQLRPAQLVPDVSHSFDGLKVPYTPRHICTGRTSCPDRFILVDFGLGKSSLVGSDWRR